MKPKKKVGILTYHHVLNEGANLQAYCQAKALQKTLGKKYDVKIIDYRVFNKEFTQWKGLIANFIKMRNPIVNFKRYRKIRSFINNEMPLTSDKLVSNNYDKAIEFISDKYDAIIVGSDEVWKIFEGKYSRPFPNAYWLSPELKCKKISSAASANRFNYEEADKKKKKQMRKFLKTFDLVGVRDDHTLNMLKYLDIEEEKSYKVPDPTFSIKFSEDIYKKVKEKLIDKGLDLNRPIMALVISSSGRKNGLSKNVADYFRKKGYQIVSISMNNEFADFYLQDILNPLEWAHVFKYFDFCLTDRFHGTIFSLQNNISFLTVDHEERYLKIRSKTVDLLEDLNLIDNHINVLKEKDIIEKIKSIHNEGKKVDYDLKLFRDNYYSHLERIKKLMK
ncbi:polysaccharide pyruvyl transferase family protein [Fuchsiella alkaliacetigena]|uniref:polysaccharide pyruvyl transferase family protein n=1 Tax=Fuchsiella alkaliacetigena TaxID=957042 RepID=UPI00200AE5D6|nr:polysaccharide pyruvyl transferase family protein [Fuchsiella alkaliacetigena]MCK8824326.1 polysaccharide pyruvyl transferase family protein [Fuchsiella alkaliacetigena]